MVGQDWKKNRRFNEGRFIFYATSSKIIAAKLLTVNKPNDFRLQITSLFTKMSSLSLS